MVEPAPSDRLLPVLAALATANDAVSPGFLARRTGLPAALIVAVLNRSDLAQFLRMVKDSGGRKFWTVCHASFADFVRNEAEVQAYLVDAERRLPRDLYNQLRDRLD